MKTKVYSFNPKGKGYTVYATKTYHGNSNNSGRSGHSGGLSDAFVNMAAKGLARGLFGKKKY